MSKFPRDSGGQPENTNALKHCGAAAVIAIQTGEPLTGPAREAELAVYEELETQGRFHLVKRNAARLQAAADCYWSAVNDLLDRIETKGWPPDMAIVKLTNVVKTFGWLSSASLRAWAQVRDEEKDSGDAVILDAIAEADGDD